MSYPKMIKIKQNFKAPPAITDIEQEVHDQLSKPDLMSAVKPGDSVAITAGSRGIANMHLILKAIVGELKAVGALPFIIPAMGSHGGATAEGQAEVLRHYKITEEVTGAPIRSSMETVQLGHSVDDIPVYMDRNAYEADHTVVVNRIKRHTDFRGKIESGLIKMMGIGLGKRDGASMYHKASLHYGFERVLRGVAEVVLGTGKIAFGLGIIENQYDETAILASTYADTLVEEEEKLQEKAKEVAAHLPFDELDVLIVDEIGKDISGLGMDSKVVGRMMHTREKDPEKPKITRIFVRDITPSSMGNAAGVGLADFTTKRLVDKMDRVSTYMNFITAMGPQKVRVPIYFDTDREVLDAVFQTIGMVEPEDSKVVRIKNTLILDKVEVSESLLEAMKERDDLEPVGELGEMEFDSEGNLVSLDHS
ncbi:lactate racemase domain-containing protein [Candidatus Poribacteria bacterium]